MKLRENDDESETFPLNTKKIWAGKSMQGLLRYEQKIWSKIRVFHYSGIKIPLWNWNDLDICSVKWNSGKFPDEMETGIFQFTLRNPDFFRFTEWKPEISGTLFRNSGTFLKNLGFYSVNRKNSSFHSVNWKKISWFHSVSRKNFQVNKYRKRS